MTEPADDFNKAFDAHRETERFERDSSIEDEIETTDRIASTIAKDEDRDG